MKNGVWEIFPRPSDNSVVTSKWIYKIKHVVDGSIDKYKAIFVARVFSQKGGIDYEETFVPNARYTTIRSLVLLATIMGCNIHQMDMKTTFLNETINEEVYIEQPRGFEENNRDTHVYRLKKALYGLKQAPREWYARMDSYLLRIGFVKSSIDPNLHIKVMNNEIVIILLYVDVYSSQIATKHILRYLLGTIHHYLKYNSKEFKLIGFTDSDWGGSETDGRSTIRGCFSLGYVMISWMSRKKYHVSLSSAKAECVVGCEVGKEAIWLRKSLIDFFEKPLDPTMINFDNQICTKMSKDLVFHARTNHINNKFHYIKKLVQDGIVKLLYVLTDDQVVDRLTNSLPNKKFEYLRSMLGLVDIVDDDKILEEIC
eukprot:PITA_27677